MKKKNEDNPHIGRLSENTPIRISSEADIDLLLQVIGCIDKLGYR